MLPVLFTACGSLQIPPKKIGFFVRDAHTGQAIGSVPVRVVSAGGDTVLPGLQTDRSGYLEIRSRDILRTSLRSGQLGSYHLAADQSLPSGAKALPGLESIRLNDYQHHYDWYLNGDASQSRAPAILPDSSLVADMHYHVSMRVQNLFGDQLYDGPDFREHIPDNINWYRDFKKLRVLYEGRWRKPYIGPIDPQKVARSEKWRRRSAMLNSLINNRYVRPPRSGSSNYLTHYTQATNPHMKQGRVGLAFNAISPFEHSVSNTSGKRMVSNALVTGAPLGWLRRIGWKTDSLTHWENFNLEYATINAQSGDLNNFHWRFFEPGVDLRDNIPTVIMVVEGSHVLQDRFFPHEFDYNLENRTQRQDKFLFDRSVRAGALLEGTYSKELFRRMVEPLLGKTAVTPGARIVLDRLLRGSTREDLSRADWNRLGPLERDTIAGYVDRLLQYELSRNIDSLKRLDGPPIMMVTVGHLTYNGMVGHAPNLDGGKFPTNIVAQKNFNIRVSDDPTYKRQWSGVFFTIPGLNKFGRQVIRELTSTENGHRIFIDLKHSDFSTRKYFFEQVMIDTLQMVTLHKNAEVRSYEVVAKNARQQIVQRADSLYQLPEDLTAYDTIRIPPICSHCCVTGLPSAYYSPLNDEFALLRSPSTTIFNPFGINLFDEEITTICQNEGIIGISLEQRVLGGYINKKELRDYKILRNGDEIRGGPYRNRRWTNVRRLFRHYRLHDSLLIKTALDYTRDSMRVPELRGRNLLKSEKRILKVTVEDYISAAPFLANLFHIIDHSGLDPQSAWNHVCIGSDLDGLIDPIDICPTASHYPFFRTRLRQFIPVFLRIRAKNDPGGTAKPFEHYFNEDFTVDMALTKLFYQSLRDFSNKHFNRSLNRVIANR